MKYIALILAVIFALTAVFDTGIGAIVSAILAGGLFIGMAILWNQPTSSSDWRKSGFTAHVDC